MKKLLLLVALITLPAWATASSRWTIAGHHAIEWNGQQGGLPYGDHVEMCGRKAAVVYYWNVDKDGHFSVNRHLVFPLLRTLPDNTHASWMPHTDIDFLDGITVNNRSIDEEKVEQVRLDGHLTAISTFKGDGGIFRVERTLWPSPTLQAVCERYVIKNTGDKEKNLRVPAVRNLRTTNSKNYLNGPYCLLAKTSIQEELSVTLKPNESVIFYASIEAYKKRQEQELKIDFNKEDSDRTDFLQTVSSNLDFTCPNDTLNTLFAMAKIRGSESITDTPVGPMQCPGGESFYGAMWCNDQAEYINPFFPFLGYTLGNESAMTTWKCYKKLINPEYKFMPWSIICNGSDTYGPFDRGDQAMLAYGASRYCLERGSKEIAEEIWPLIEWCLEYCHRKLNEQGVVASDADELEYRLPAGKANLCTSCLYYDALISAAYLAEALDKPKQVANIYRKQATVLRKNIDLFFHHDMEGYDTYRYYEGNDKLRSWISIPLTMGIYDRAKGTVEAMFSPKLWTENGMLSVSSDKIFWDRTTLYGLRGALAAGYTGQGIEFLQKFSTTRLLGEHVPYMVEAWPEGGQRHLSTENALYCRIFTEGLLGFRATGFHSFDLTPQMPQKWDKYSFKNVHACTKQPMDIEVTRLSTDKLQVKISKEGHLVCQRTVKTGQTLHIR